MYRKLSGLQRCLGSRPRPHKSVAAARGPAATGGPSRNPAPGTRPREVLFYYCAVAAADSRRWPMRAMRCMATSVMSQRARRRAGVAFQWSLSAFGATALGEPALLSEKLREPVLDQSPDLMATACVVKGQSTMTITRASMRDNEQARSCCAAALASGSVRH